jgi:oligo-1,6-glucosidase
LATFQLTSKGTPFIYQGDELGMTNYPFASIEDFDDIEVKNTWKAEVLTNRVSAEEYLDHIRKTSRDNTRTPMQWDDSPNGGFTAATKAWFAVNPNYQEINAKQALADQNSIYHYFRKLLELRKQTPALIYGDYQDLDPENPSVFAYTRILEPDKYLVVLNFAKSDVVYTRLEGLKEGQLVLSNLDAEEKNASRAHLRAWEARIYKL